MSNKIDDDVESVIADIAKSLQKMVDKFGGRIAIIDTKKSTTTILERKEEKDEEVL